MALNSFTTKFSYLDGVYFAINPVFDNDYDHRSSSNNQKKSRNGDNDSLVVDELLSYDFSKAQSILDYKHDFTAEATFLYNEHQMRQPKSSRVVVAAEPKSIVVANNLSSDSTITTATISSSYSTSPTPHNQLGYIQATTTYQSTALSSSLPLDKISHHQQQHSVNTQSNNSSTLDPVKSKVISVPSNVLASYQNANGLLEPERVSTSRREINNNNNGLTSKKRQTDALFGGFGVDDSSSLDPFNDLELKTINEFEELKNILNNTSRPPTTTTIESTTSNIKSSDLTATTTTSNTAGGASSVDNFGLPKISFT